MPKAPVKIVHEYCGHTITISDDTRMSFSVSGPLFQDQWFGSYVEARTAIEEAVKADEAQNRRQITLSVLDEQGDRRTVTGVHAGHGAVLGMKGGRHFSPTCRGWRSCSNAALSSRRN